MGGSGSTVYDLGSCVGVNYWNFVFCANIGVFSGNTIGGSGSSSVLICDFLCSNIFCISLNCGYSSAIDICSCLDGLNGLNVLDGALNSLSLYSVLSSGAHLGGVLGAQGSWDLIDGHSGSCDGYLRNLASGNGRRHDIVIVVLFCWLASVLL